MSQQADVVWNPTLSLYVPRVTSVLRVMDKYYLRRWFAQEAAKHGIKAGLAISFDEDVNLEERARVCVEAIDQEVAATADFGTEVHQWLHYFNSGKPVEPTERIAAVVAPWPAWFEKNVIQVFSSEWQVFGEFGRRYYAGTADLVAELRSGTRLGHGGRTLQGDTWAVIDFKTGGQYYDDWGYQVAAYTNAITSDPNPYLRLTIRLDRQKPGKVYCKEWVDYDNDLGMFRDCLSIWYRQNQHRLTDMVQSSMNTSTQKEIACLASNPTPSTN